MFNLRKGLGDERVVNASEQKIYAGTDTRDHYVGWNVSVETPTHLQRLASIQEETYIMQQKSKQISEQYVATTNYKTPYQQAKEGNLTLKEEKEADAQLKKTIIEKVAYEMPRASKERVEATVFRKMYEKKNIENEPYDPELTLKPNMKKTLINRKGVKYHHTGKFEMCKFEEEEVWSCCMNADPNSPGCNAIKVDPLKWNLTSYT